MTTDQSQIPSKAEVMARINRAWAALEQTVAGLTEAQLTEPRDEVGWSAKDHLLHLAAWERSMTVLFQGRPRPEGLGVSERLYLEGSFDEINAEIRRQTADLPLAEALARWRDAHRELLAALGPLTDADLARTYSDFLPDEPGQETGEPIVNRLAGNTYEHFDEHRTWIEALTR